MVISVLQFGLGNQLFQYAAGRAVAARLCTPLLLDTTHFTYLRARTLDLKQLSIAAHWLPDALAKLLAPGAGASAWKTALKKISALALPTLTDATQGYDPRILALGRFCRLDGYWQSERYFAHLRPQLLAELKPCAGLPEPLAALVRRLASEESIALHVRRGDLVTDRHYAESVGALGAAYYEQALTRLQARFPGARVYLFSDDAAWCEQHIPRILPLELVSGRLTHSAVEDLTVMKHCRHFIMANSTFSWWAAWLGEHPSKQVIAPASFFRQPRTWEKDLLPPAWETLEPSFEEIA